MIESIYTEKYFTGEQSSLAWGKFGYDTNYFHDKQSEKIKIAYRNIVEIERIIPTKGKLLDIGCAAGFFLKVAKDMSWETYGIELSDYAARYAREEFDLNVQTGTTETIEFPEKYFDVITMWDVIEHLPNPRSFIRDISQLLSKNGLLVLGTPNAESLAAMLKRKKWCHFNPPEHLFYFGPSTLQNLVQPFFKSVDVKPVRAPYSRIQPSVKMLLKRFLFIQFNNFSSLIGMGEYLKAYAFK